MIDFAVIARQILDAAVGALGEGAVVVETRAKQLAPVRRLFNDGGQGVAYKSIADIEANREAHARIFKPIAERLGMTYRPEEFGVATKAVGKRPPVRWHQRSISRAEEHLAAYDAEMARRRAGEAPQPTFLSRQGAYEVRSKRAVAASWKHLYVGGRLRGEIRATAPVVTGDSAEAWVISPTPYAKYQEFGTRHNAAHPFLRPAADESREDIVSRIAAAVQEASRTGASHTDIEIVVRL